MPYLDNTGLAYFCGKIKTWANSVFALIFHTHASSDVAAMTGYSKPLSTGAIASGDTLNQAIGKLEKAIDDADISNTVHVSGNEFIGGIKEFGNSYYDSTHAGETDWESSSLIIRYQNYVKGSGNPAANKYASLLFLDKTGTNINWSGRLGSVENYVLPSGAHATRLICYKNEIVNGVDTRDATSITVGYDANNIKYATCPDTSENRNVENDILTRNWIPKDSRIVHITGDEIITGRKTFTRDMLFAPTSDSSAGRYIIVSNSSLTQGTAPSSNVWHGYSIRDKDNNVLVQYSSIYHSDGSAAARLSAEPTSSISRGVVIRVYPNASSNFMPVSTNSTILGSGNYRWKEIWCNQSSINSSSDERLKTDILAIPDNVLDAWAGISWVQYRMKDAVEEKGEDARFHAGAIAQEIGRVFRREGLDASRYGFFLYDEWDAVPEERDENGKLLQRALLAGDEYGLRYAEALCMEAAYMRRENARLKKRVADLEERLAALELKVS